MDCCKQETAQRVSFFTAGGLRGGLGGTVGRALPKDCNVHQFWYTSSLWHVHTALIDGARSQRRARHGCSSPHNPSGQARHSHCIGRAI